MFRYYGSRSYMTADLKRTAHEIRQRLDAIEVQPGGRNPRKERQIVRASLPGSVREDPRLGPKARHTLAWGSKRIA